MCREGSSLALGKHISLLLSRGLLLELSEKSFAVQQEFFFQLFPTFKKSVSRSRGSWARKFNLQLTGHWFFPRPVPMKCCAWTPTAPAVPRGVASGSGSWWGGQESSSGCPGRPMVGWRSGWVVGLLLPSECNCNRAVFLRGHTAVSSARFSAPIPLPHHGPCEP